VFAPGHLGELTRHLPFELVDDVLAQTRTTRQRLRALPSRTGVYFVLALGLFPQTGYARVCALPPEPHSPPRSINCPLPPAVPASSC
jgi:hypothetical protein